MRLLHTTTFEFEFFPGQKKPFYAILSHTWEEEEVLFEDARHGRRQLRQCRKAGLAKVLKAAELARNDGLDWIWIDTCCIDKSSSAELSEAINSMFVWYAEAYVCYAFLSDYKSRLKLSECRPRWFQRGWTLQELIAPVEVIFYDSQWTPFGNRTELLDELSLIVKVDQQVLRRQPNVDSECTLGHCKGEAAIRNCDLCKKSIFHPFWRLGPSWNLVSVRSLLAQMSISSRMSWAADRKTTRAEDKAYCLLGIFNVNMPLIYGEGSSKAFQRLQQEILQNSRDHSLLVWNNISHLQSNRPVGIPILAPDPKYFDGLDCYQPISSASPITFTNRGAELDVFLTRGTGTLYAYGKYFNRRYALWVAVLDCYRKDEYFTSPALLLEDTDFSSNSFRQFRWTLLDAGKFLVEIQPKQSVYQAKLRGNTSLELSFDPSLLKRTRILLQEEVDISVLRIEIPTITPICPNGLLDGYEIESIEALLGTHAPVLIHPDFYNPIYPPILRDNIPDGAYMVYGLTTLGNREIEGVKFLILCGMRYDSEEEGTRALRGPCGWHSGQSKPFCAIWTMKSQHLTALLNENLERHHLDNHTKLGEAVVRTITRIVNTLLTAPDSTFLPDQNYSPKATSTCTDSTGRPVSAKAEVSIQEFLGRKRFLLSVSMHNTESDALSAEST
ncbi:heterokaryon incompatibility protein-domain-containing protein [Echria macrotheca]|uniref:Heterokaryon incompatibility protein-domain-containing protein n=1 Tax=Echria macrotheca TaxID=438768 RepID=A0AAJ0BM91_9PEZI|nr:heterokaryon incompatibility protein-domain-containing protein [Echria macrotheca]